MRNYIQASKVNLNNRQRDILFQFLEVKKRSGIVQTTKQEANAIANILSKMNDTNEPIFNPIPPENRTRMESKVYNDYMLDILTDLISLFAEMADINKAISIQKKLQEDFINRSTIRALTLRNKISEAKVLVSKGNGFSNTFTYSFEIEKGHTFQNTTPNTDRGILRLSENPITTSHYDVVDVSVNRITLDNLDGVTASVTDDHPEKIVQAGNFWIESILSDFPIQNYNYDKSFYDGALVKIDIELLTPAPVNKIAASIISEYEVEFPVILYTDNPNAEPTLVLYKKNDYSSIVSTHPKSRNFISVENFPAVKISKISLLLYQDDYESRIYNIKQQLDQSIYKTLLNIDSKIENNNQNNLALLDIDLRTLSKDKLNYYNDLLNILDTKIKTSLDADYTTINRIFNEVIPSTVDPHEQDLWGKVKNLYLNKDRLIVSQEKFIYSYGIEDIKISNINYILSSSGNVPKYISPPIDAKEGHIIQIGLSSTEFIPKVTQNGDEIPTANVKYSIFIPEYGQWIPILPSHKREIEAEVIYPDNNGNFTTVFAREGHEYGSELGSTGVAFIYKNGKYVDTTLRPGPGGNYDPTEHAVYTVRYTPPSIIDVDDDEGNKIRKEYKPQIIDLREYIPTPFRHPGEYHLEGTDANNTIVLDRYPYTQNADSVILQRANTKIEPNTNYVVYNNILESVPSRNDNTYIFTVTPVLSWSKDTPLVGPPSNIAQGSIYTDPNIDTNRNVDVQVNYEIDNTKGIGSSESTIGNETGGYIVVRVNGVICTNLTDLNNKIKPDFTGITNSEYQYYLDGNKIIFNKPVPVDTEIIVYYNYLYSYIQLMIEIDNPNPMFSGYTPIIYDYTLKFRTI